MTYWRLFSCLRLKGQRSPFGVGTRSFTSFRMTDKGSPTSIENTFGGNEILHFVQDDRQRFRMTDKGSPTSIENTLCGNGILHFVQDDSDRRISQAVFVDKWKRDPERSE